MMLLMGDQINAEKGVEKDEGKLSQLIFQFFGIIGFFYIIPYFLP